MNQLFKFKPILKEKIWGGEKLMEVLNKTSNKTNIGESWEISDVEKDTSIVANGALKGKSLKEIIGEFKGDLVGEKVYAKFGDNFPLLIKFIDAKEALSIQLHPNDKLAKKLHNSFGKTEMWYVMQADKHSNLIIGFKNLTTPEQYLYHLKNKTLTDILNIEKVKKGDAYFIPTGRVHAIGAGVMLAEIQQTSDVTYRIYDWDREDDNGNLRELHTKEAIKAIEYKSEVSFKSKYKKTENKTSQIVSCKYFTTNFLPIIGEVNLNNTDKDSFVVYMCVSGEVIFSIENQSEKLKIGETILIPASVGILNVSSEEKSELLEVYIK